MPSIRLVGPRPAFLRPLGGGSLGVFARSNRLDADDDAALSVVVERLGEGLVADHSEFAPAFEDWVRSRLLLVGSLVARGPRSRLPADAPDQLREVPGVIPEISADDMG